MPGPILLAPLFCCVLKSALVAVFAITNFPSSSSQTESLATEVTYLHRIEDSLRVREPKVFFFETSVSLKLPIRAADRMITT